MYQHMNSGVPLMARAVVVANKDPDQLGRVKVTYPWMGAASSEVPSNWAFVCMPYASKEGGFFVIPEKGDEVLVFFENGNLDSPIIVGSVYNKKTKPAASGKGDDYNSSGNNSLRYLKTRSGHLLCFDDSDSEGGIVIKDKDNRRFEIQTKKKKITISDENGNQIELDGSKIEVSCKDTKIEINSSKVQISAGSSNQVTVEKGGVTIQAASSIRLGSGATDSLIKGDQFLQLFNMHMHPTAMGPSGPPMVPLNPMVLSRKVKVE